ncbi:MAG: hypothetical protein ACI9BO_000336, partial [Zhongshania sp.]
KCWRLKYRYSGKEKTLAPGVYPDVRDPEARKFASQAKDTLKAGIAPSRERKKDKRHKC